MTEATGSAGGKHYPLRISVERHLRWLLEGPLRTPGGMLAAWADGPIPAHTYQESTGYLVTLLCYLYRVTGQDRYRDEAAATVGALMDDMAQAPGCGRDGVIYLFDTAVCLRALGAFNTLFEEHTPPSARVLMERLARTLQGMIERQQACTPVNGEADRWSRSFSAHLIKAAHLVSPWIPGWRPVMEALVDRFYRDGRFYADATARRVYLHASCYASEGLLARPNIFPEERARVAAFLAQIQRADGGIPAWWPEDSGPVTDATAQALRVWQCVDAGAFADHIERGFAFLDSVAQPGGGFRYSPRIAHANSWATIFAVQALIWRDLPAEPLWIV